MNRIVVVCKKTQCSESGIINETLMPSSVDEPSYLKLLGERAAAADRGELASETEVTRFFAEHDV